MLQDRMVGALDASEAARSQFSSFDMFGYKVTPMTVDDQLRLIDRSVEANELCVISPLNVHGLRVLQCEPEMRELHRAPFTHVVVDGMPIVALCRLAGIRATRDHRVTNLDLIWPLLSLAEKRGWRIYYLGGREDVLLRGLKAIERKLPGLRIRAHHGFVGMDCPDVVADLRQFGAQVVMVGMGTGLQDRWILRNSAALPGSTFMSVGALMEYVAGAVRTPPRWMGRLGLEWLFRLGEDPRRFWRRYLLEPWAVLWTIAVMRGAKQHDRL